MKKLLALLLAVATLLTIVTVPAVAQTTKAATPVGDQNVAPGATLTNVVTNISNSDSEVMYNGESYKVIRNYNDFMSITSGGKYILAQNIDLTKGGTNTLNGNAISGAAGNFTLEGNGYTVTLKMNNTKAGHGLFGQPAVGSTTTIRNVKFVASGTLAQNSTGILLGTTAGHSSTGHVYFTNVHLQSNGVTFTGAAGATDQGTGLFFAKPRIATTFTNCELSGSFNSTHASGKAGVAGFVGLADINSAKTVSFIGCKATGTYNFSNDAGNASGIFVGRVGSTTAGLYFDNCEVDATVTMAGEHYGAFIGHIEFPATNLSIANSTVKGSLTAAKRRCGGFVGYMGKGFVSFTNCTVGGTLTFNGGQSAGFLAMVESNSDDSHATFENCLSNATIIAKGGKTGCFIGQNYNNNTNYRFTNCKASGVLLATSDNCGGFIGCAGGSYDTTRKTCAVVFDGCDADIFMVGVNTIASYVGTNGGGTPTLTYMSCKNNATVFSSGSGGSWIAYPNSGSVKASLSFQNNCTNNARVTATSLYNEKNYYVDDATFEKAADPEIAIGALAYDIAQAQKQAGITNSAYIYGQTIGTDKVPVMGGATVYKLPLPDTDPIYSNLPAVDNYYLLDPEVAYYHQTVVVDGKYQDRIIIVVEEEKLLKIDTFNVKLSYTLIDGSQRTFNVDQDQLSTFFSVYAGDQVAMAPAGYLLLAITVKNIPQNEWAGTLVTVDVTETLLPEATTLKFGSYNIYQSIYDKSGNAPMANIAKVIVDSGLDIIGLQEVDKFTTRTPFDVMATLVSEIEKLTGEKYYYQFYRAMYHMGGQYGDAILSKYPIVESERYALEMSDEYEDRVLGRAKIQIEEGVYVNFFVTHLCHVSDANRREQLEMIADVLKDYDDYVLTGDFNTDNFSLFSTIDGANMVNNQGFNVVTFEHNYYAIDNIVYAGSAWRFSIPRTIKDSYSDHYLLYATGVSMK